MANKHTNPYTEEMDAFLIENIEGTTFPKLTEMFNEKFNENRTRSAIWTHCHHVLKVGNGLKYLVSSEELPIGTIRVFGRRTYIKVSCDKGYGDKDHNFRHNWKLLNRVNCKDTKGKCVVHLNNDLHDNTPDNLMETTPYATGKCARSKLFSEHPMITKLALKTFELEEKVNEKVK